MRWKNNDDQSFSGFYPAEQGELYVDGVSPVLESVTARTRLAYIAEQVSLYPVLTGRENLDYFTRLSGRALNRTESDELFQCARLNLSDADRRVSEYSKGMRQKSRYCDCVGQECQSFILTNLYQVWIRMLQATLFTTQDSE